VARKRGTSQHKTEPRTDGAGQAQSEPANGGTARPASTPRWRVWLTLHRRVWLRRVAAALALIIALPFVLTLLYALPFVRPVSTLMVWDLVTLQGYSRDWRAIDDISPNLKHSVVMSEDGQFCSHHGIDLRELKGVVEDALEGESPRGASTITMQVAKNLFLWNSRSLVRKALELPLAVYIDLVLPKRRIMEIYLNIAEWGPDGIYGIGAGASHHFGVDAASMTRRQAALLTVTLPNPIVRDPARPTRGMTNVARLVERRARNAGDYVGCLAPRP
jgi:monofunctional biosynthetic peptidoglycan transglycosylase